MEAIATMLANSAFGVPDAYRGDVGSCFNAVDIAYRLGVSPLVVLQNSREIDGKPAFTYQFAKALIEDSGLIDGYLQYETEGQLSSDGTPGDGPAYRIRAYGNTREGSRLNGPWINWKMAEIERWTDNISYISMPEVMFRARATTFFFNQHCSSLLMGFQIEGDPAVGTAKNGTAAASLNDLKLPVLATGASGDQIFANALSATAKADPVAIGAASTQVHQVPSTGVDVESKGSESVNTGSSVVKPASATESPKPRGRKPKGADATATQSTPPPDGNQTPPELLLTDATSPAAALQVEDSDQATSDVDCRQTVTSQTQGELPPMEQQVASSSLQKSIENFSIAFAKVDALAPSGESLKQSMALVKTFESQEAEDLYLVLLSNSERILTSFVGTGRGLTADEGDFAAAVRDLYSSTKELATKNTDLNDRRKALYSAYTGLLAYLQKAQAATSA